MVRVFSWTPALHKPAHGGEMKKLLLLLCLVSGCATPVTIEIKVPESMGVSVSHHHRGK